MSETDSFIEEVAEEVRRDRLFKMFRRYGWIAALVVIVIVGAASWNEYRKATAHVWPTASIVSSKTSRSSRIRFSKLPPYSSVR